MRFLFEGIAGIETPDRHTLVIRLKQPDFNFSHVLAFPLAGAVAREAIEHYGDESAAGRWAAGRSASRATRARRRSC
jgi:ABC-type oligopeptide transport system substrate-binding subunit